MKIDDTITKVFEQIKVEVKEKFNIDISTQELFNIIKTQLDATRLGFSKLVSIHWIGFGKFIFTDKYNRKHKYFENLEKVNNPDFVLTEQQREELRKELIIDNAEKKRELTSENRNTKPIEVDALLAIESKVKPVLPMFKNLTKKR